MARESWIKVTHELRNKPELIELAARCCGGDRNLALGRYVAFLCYADLHSSAHRRVSRLSISLSKFLDELTGIDNFYRELEAVGWLKFDEPNGSVILPNFHRHNGNGAKRRAMDAARKQAKRASAKRPQNVRRKADKCPPEMRLREEKRREEYKPHIPFDSGGHFEALREAYPLKLNADDAAEEFAKIPPESVGDVIKAAKNYAAASASRNHYDSRLDKWLSSGEWRRWVNTPTVVDPRERAAELAKAGLPWS